MWSGSKLLECAEVRVRLSELDAFASPEEGFVGNACIETVFVDRKGDSAEFSTMVTAAARNVPFGMRRGVGAGLRKLEVRVLSCLPSYQ